jgi:hypothetical protein
MGSLRFDQDRLAVTIAVAPAGAEIPRPESVPQLDQLTDVIAAPSTTTPPVSGSAPGTAPDTTAAPAGEGDPGTTVAP